MEALTDSPPGMRSRKPNRVRDNAMQRERVQIDALREVRAAWQGLLGPAPLLPDLLDSLLLLSNTRKVKTGQQVLWRTEVARELLLVVQGAVGLGWLAPPAPLRIERSLRGPAWLDLSSAWLNCCPTVDGVALSDAVLVNVSRSAYQTLMARQPELARRTVGCLAEQLHAATRATQALMHKDAQARLAAFLVQRCGVDATASQIVLHERKRDIASQLAVTPETLSRLLKQFSDEGLVEVHGYTIAILDVAGLRARQSAAAAPPR